MRRALPAAVFIVAANLAHAQTPPPDRPTIAYTIEFAFERFEAGFSEKGQRRISVSGELIRDQALSGDDRTVYIADRKAGTLTEFDPADPQRLIRVGPLGEMVMPMAEGYRPLLARQGAPRLLGPDRVAGTACTRLAWQGQGADRQEWCVSAQGIVLRAERKAGLTGTRLVATRLDLAAPDPALFSPPPGFGPAPASPQK